MKRFNFLQYGYPEKAKEKLLALRESAMAQVRPRRVRLYAASVKGIGDIKWGYINHKGEFIIKPEYGYGYDFQDNGLAIVEDQGKYGVIKASGQYLVKPEYDFINQFSQGLAVASDETGFKVINENGAVITRKPYPYIVSYQNGRAAFLNQGTEADSRYGYLDKEGKEVIRPQYQYASHFKNGKAVVQMTDGKYALIDLNGKILNKYNYAYVGDLGDGLLSFQENVQGKYGFMDEKGRVVISPRYTSVEPFHQGRTVVNISEDGMNQYGLIDKKGRFIIKPAYNDINRLGEKRAAVGIPINKEKPFMSSKYAVYDTDGKQLSDFMYLFVSEYKNGLASAYDRQNTFFIDKKGKRLEKMVIVKGTGTLVVEGDIIKADVDQRILYLDQSGTIIWQQNTVIPLNNPYRVIEEKFKPNMDYLVYYPQVSGITDQTIEQSINDKLRNLSQLKAISDKTQLDYNYYGDFLVEFFKKHLLELNLMGYEYYFGFAHGMPTKIYVHIDLNNGRFYELKDLFKADSDYVKVLSDIIENQIKTNEAYSYVWFDQYKGIRKDQPFYVSEDALYIYFYPYEIAPYAAGFPTFKIPYKDIMGMIDTEGAFWQSFN